MPDNPLDIEALKALEAAAPPDWYVYVDEDKRAIAIARQTPKGGKDVAHKPSRMSFDEWDKICAFIVALRNAAPALLELAERAVEAAKKHCSVCGERTELACVDCKMELNTSVYVCQKRECRDAHEEVCLNTRLTAATTRIAELEHERDDFLGQLTAYRESEPYFTAQAVMNRENNALARITELEALLAVSENRADEMQRQRAALSDKLNGEPCAEIRWQQERDRLTARIVELEATAQTACGACGQPWTGEKCGQAENGHPFPTCYPFVEVADDALTVANARIAELEEALRPFAEEAEPWSPDTDDDYRPENAELKEKGFLAETRYCVGDLRRAARALAPT